MIHYDSESVRTRTSLVAALQKGDERGWRDFYELYGPLIRRFAVKAGLTEAEAEDALQETAIALTKHLPDFAYDPKVCRFKTWLLNQTTWRVKDQLKKRRRRAEWIQFGGEAGEVSDAPYDGARAGALHSAADPKPDPLVQLWEDEWRESLVAAALRNLKPRWTDRQFQIFDLNVIKNWPAREVAQSLGVTLATVYIAKHRVSAALKKEIIRLERMPLPQSRSPGLVRSTCPPF